MNDELREQVEQAVARGWTTERITRALHVTAEQVGDVIRGMDVAAATLDIVLEEARETARKEALLVYRRCVPQYRQARAV